MGRCMGLVARPVYANPKHFRPIRCPVRCGVPSHKELSAAEFAEMFGKSDPELANEYKRKMIQHNDKSGGEQAKQRALPQKMKANKGTGKWTKSWETQNKRLKAKMRKSNESLCKEDKSSIKYAIDITKLCPKCGEAGQYDCNACKAATCSTCDYKFCWMCGIEKLKCTRWSDQNCDMLYKKLKRHLDKEYPWYRRPDDETSDSESI